MSDKFTPGPWKFRTEKLTRGKDKGNEIRVDLWNDKRQAVLSVDWSTFFNGDVWEMWLKLSPANATLIEAAPDLLKALEEAVQCLGDLGIPCPNQRAAIAKAIGESSLRQQQEETVEK